MARTNALKLLAKTLKELDPSNRSHAEQIKRVLDQIAGQKVTVDQLCFTSLFSLLAYDATNYEVLGQLFDLLLFLVNKPNSKLLNQMEVPLMETLRARFAIFENESRSTSDPTEDLVSAFEQMCSAIEVLSEADIGNVSRSVQSEFVLRLLQNSLNDQLHISARRLCSVSLSTLVGQPAFSQVPQVLRSLSSHLESMGSALVSSGDYLLQGGFVELICRIASLCKSQREVTLSLNKFCRGCFPSDSKRAVQTFRSLLLNGSVSNLLSAAQQFLHFVNSNHPDSKYVVFSKS